jgi:hypothetical protein
MLLSLWGACADGGVSSLAGNREPVLQDAREAAGVISDSNPFEALPEELFNFVAVRGTRGRHSLL